MAAIKSESQDPFLNWSGISFIIITFSETKMMGFLHSSFLHYNSS